MAKENGDKRETKAPKAVRPVEVTFSEVSLRRLDALVREGSYGVTRPEVIRHFLEAGLREARKAGHITDDDWAAATSPTVANSPSTGG